MRILALTITSLVLAGELWSIPVASVPAAPAWPAGYKVRYPLHIPGERSRSPATTIVARLPTGGWALDDAADVTVLTADGQVLPVAVLSHVADGHTLIQFMRQGNDAWYWAYAAHPDASAPHMAPVHEGMTVEIREWAGDNFESWPAVRDGLQKSKVIGCFLMAEAIQGVNYARPSAPANLAVSIRGVLNIKTAGEYRLFANSEDAAFLFIDGFKVDERTGSNIELTGKVSMSTTGVLLNLTAGHHPFEIHQVTSDNSGASGRLYLLWVKPGTPTWMMPYWTDYVPADYGRVATIETAPGFQGAAFVAGLDETLMTPSGLTLSIMTFTPHGMTPGVDGDQLIWDFGDGTAPVTGRHPTHIYFEYGDYTVSLRLGDSPPFRQTIHVWPAPGNTSPFSAAKAIGILETANWQTYDAERINQMFEFLQTCEQPNRWKLLAAMATYLLLQEEPDLQYRSELYTVNAEALARLGREADALALIDKVLPEFDRLRNAQVALHLTAAWVFHRQLKETKNADERYERILEDFRGLDHPSMRLAAIRRGDLAAEGGDLAQAEERYRIADALGGSEFEVTSQAKAITRGGMLRMAEKKLRSGDIRETRALLDKIELHYPQQKLSGLYRFLRAETDRIGGRYEAALRSYEVLLRLAQWADFHDSAILGVANCYYRMRDYERATAWLRKLMELYPEFYQAQNGDAFATVVAKTVERVHHGGVGFADVFASFEPQDQVVGKTNYGVSAGLAVDGSHVLLMDNHPPHRGPLKYSLDLPNLSGDSWYWVELWYRETLDHLHPSVAAHIATRIVGSDGETLAATHSDGNFVIRGTFGMWHKAGYLHKTPMTLDGKYTAMVTVSGIIELDSLAIRRVTDQQYDALFNLIEGRSGER